MTGPDPAVAATRVAVRNALGAVFPDPYVPGRPGAHTCDHTPSAPGTPHAPGQSLHHLTTVPAPPHDPRPETDGGVATARPAGRVLVACSGGPDSLALAAAAAFVAPRMGLSAGAVVVDHGLQDGSAQVAARAAAQCRDLGLDPVCVERVVVGTGGGPEAAARSARYAALARAASSAGADVVLLGHTLDDQAEQVLLALGRGAGARSLAAMPARRGIYLRPFLGLRRVTTAAACAAANLEPWHDPTNTMGPGRRTRVRTEVMPLLTDVFGPGVPLALTRTADQLRVAAEALDAGATTLLAQARTDDGAVVVDVLVDAPAAVRRAALRAMAVATGCPAGSLGTRHVCAMDALVMNWHGQGPVSLPGHVLARRDRAKLWIQPSPRTQPSSTPPNSGTQPTSTPPSSGTQPTSPPPGHRTPPPPPPPTA
ncbi:MAG: tRNA lysidine(34) synthetase TilS, partial [Micrococcales bacterium]|nr:tRNA lysidine(34) synthetase TilS [Micrococcales bacterium]